MLTLETERVAAGHKGSVHTTHVEDLDYAPAPTWPRLLQAFDD